MARLEQEAQEWIEQITGEYFSGSFAESLKDGIILCKLINRIKPGSVHKINEPATMPFKKMENIANYLKGVRALGMKEFQMFGTPDLFEEKNLAQVVKSIHALGSLVQSIMPDAPFPKLGVKLTEKNERHFNEDQMRQAKAAVSVLSMGSSNMAKNATAAVLQGKDAQPYLSAGRKPSADATTTSAPVPMVLPPAASRPGAPVIVAPHLKVPLPPRAGGGVPPKPAMPAAAAAAPAPVPVVAAPAPVVAAPLPAIAAPAPVVAALPPGWQELKTPEGETYYFHEATGTTQWDKPAAPAAAPAPAPIPAPAPAPVAAAAPSLPAGWEELRTETGEAYYYNSTTGETSWEKPSDGSGADAAAGAAAMPAPAPAAGLPDGWGEYRTDEGEVYYAHADGRTSWERPTA